MNENCGICKNPIFTKYQSYHLDGTGVYHMSCELGRKPATQPGFRYDAGMKNEADKPVSDARLLRSIEGRKPNAKVLA